MKRGIIASAILSLAFAAFAEAIDWSRAEDVQRGVKLFRRDYTEPRLMKAYWFRVDLRTPGLRFAGTECDESWGEVMADCTNRVEYVRTRRRTTADFMREQRAAGRDMIVAFNCSPWTPFCPPWNFRYADPSGLNIVDGVVVSEHPKARNPLFVVWKDGRCEIAESIPADRYADVAVAQSGFTIVVRNGETVVKPGGACHPRMVYGLSRDRRYMYVLAVDGRQKGWALGADLFDLAGMMKDAGAYDAVNMDGGGSTTLVYWNGREPVMVNRHDAARKSVRANGSNLGIWLSTLPSSARKIVVLGDSYVANHAESVTNTWHFRYAESRGLEYRAYGRNGNGLTIDRNGLRMSERYRRMRPDADCVVVIGGHNDAALIRKGIGTREQFNRELAVLIDGLRLRYPKAGVCFVTPWKVDEPCFPEMLDDLRRTCREKGVACYDAAAESGIDPNDPAVRTKWFQSADDRAHLNREGHGVMLERVAPFLDRVFGH